MKKEKLTGKLWAKICAYFLLAVCVCGMLASVAGIYAAWEFHVYTSDLPSLKTTAFRQIVVSYGNNLVHWIAVSQDYALAEEQTAFKNAEYRVLDHEGNELWRSENYDALNSEYTYAWVYAYISNERAEYVVYSGNFPGDFDELEENDYVAESKVNMAFPLNDQLYWVNVGLNLLWSVRYAVYVIAVLCLLLGIACVVFLLCGAGHRAGQTELVPGYLYRIPFDLLMAAFALWVATVVWLAKELTYNIDAGIGEDVFAIFLFFAVVLCIALPFTGLCASFAMRVKLGGWWRNTVIFLVLRLCGRVLRSVWNFFLVVGHGVVTLTHEIPLVWRTALALVVMGIIELFCIAASDGRQDVLVGLWFIKFLVLIPGVLYIALTLRRLQEGGAALAAGNLHYQTNTRRMLWDFRKHGENLNSIAAGMTRAVAEQLKSERLKTELITNVSHDIKTPLTSIINYVDLMKRNHDTEKASEYLEVLDRQSRKLKKLTEDLVEVSKASTGNLEVNAARHSVHELVRQVTGEYSERLEAAGLEPVFTLPEQELFAWVDGTLMWRVLDNLFSNVCKYAQSGTRFYIDVHAENGKARLSFKNISRESLNVPADELMERFVRGDAARSGEGSGLGLHIARTLTELQGGEFSLTVDGDLFKVEIALQTVQ